MERVDFFWLVVSTIRLFHPKVVSHYVVQASFEHLGSSNPPVVDSQVL